ncbi:MAG: hypothetical protein JXK07_09615 [Spirochaetes bacterium]|nr:hypothetical protein [Spirochaetota bacterium]MBN2772540.1 hypothetical protein [Spirochaetota bacterium]
MTRKTKKKKRSISSSDRGRWSFFPLYGLIINGDDGLSDPLFGDATLVSRETVVQLVEKENPNAKNILCHGKMTDIAPDLDWSKIPVPKAHLVEIVPHSYIAVKTQSTQNATERRVTMIRVFLSAMMVLRGNLLKVFSGDSMDVAWSMMAGNIQVESGKPASSARIVLTNEKAVVTPLEVSKDALRKSWETGSDIPNQRGIQWDIGKMYPVSRLLTIKHKGKRQNKLANIGVHIVQSCLSRASSAQLAMAVTAYELLMFTHNFKKLKERMTPFFSHGNQLDMLSDIFEARHSWTHEGKILSKEMEKTVTMNALMFAWILFDISAAYLEVTESQEQFEHIIDAQVSILKMVEDITPFTQENELKEVKNSAFKVLKNNFAIELTVRRK